MSNAGQIQRTRHAVANPAYAYDAFSLFQRACTYAYDVLAHACMSHTYDTAATVIVIASAFRRAPTTTTPNVPHRNGTIKNARKQDKHTINSLFTNDIGKVNPPSIRQARTYGTPLTTYSPSTAATPTTTYSATVTHNTTTIETLPETPPTTHPIHHYYGYRYYSPELGRWPSRDPIEEEGFLLFFTEWHLPEAVYNPYAFVDNAPSYKYDALGLLTLGDYWDWFTGKKCWKCGPDVTEGLKSVQLDVEARFKTLTKEQKFANCAPFALDTFDPSKYLWALIAWDIHGLAFEDVRVRGSSGVSLCPFGRGCKETVMVDGKCHWKWNVNYLLYGWMNKQCGVSKSRMKKVAKTYKFLKGDWGDVGMAAQFAGAGHDGWPSGGSIPDDKNYKDCGSCSEKYSCSFWSSWPDKDPSFWKPIWDALKDIYF